jgi:integrase/recombinase XerD
MTANDIQCRLEAYLELRRSLGFVVRYEAYALKELLQYIQSKGLSWPIQSQIILDWVAVAPHCGPAGQRARLIHARGFLRHLKASFPETEVPPPGILAPVIRPKPYLYTAQETASLLQATHRLWPSGSLQQITHYTLIGLLASTGLRPGESLHLALDDVRLDAAPPHLEVRHTKFYKSRLVPIHSTTVEQLRRYLVERNRLPLSQPSNAFFLSGRGRPLSYTTLRRTFAQIARVAGVKKTDGQRGPCLHSFRHGFAVGRLLTWYRACLEVSSWLPHLSVYLGHLNKEETYWYLTATPDCLRRPEMPFAATAMVGSPNDCAAIRISGRSIFAVFLRRAF